MHICDSREDITVVDVLIERCPAKGHTEISVFLGFEEGAYCRRGVMVVAYLALDEIGDGVVIPDFERRAFGGEIGLILILGIIGIIRAYRLRQVGVSMHIRPAALDFPVYRADMYAELLGDFFRLISGV